MPKLHIVHATLSNRLVTRNGVSELVQGFPNEAVVLTVKGKEELELPDYYQAARRIISEAFMDEEFGRRVKPQVIMADIMRGNLFGEIMRSRGTWTPIPDSAHNIGELLGVMRTDPTVDPDWAAFKYLPEVGA